MNPTPIFSPAEILLPGADVDLTRWAVVACDQFTSDPAYWEACEAIVGDAPSTYRYILPEAYLGTEKEKTHGESVAAAMNALRRESMTAFNGMIYLERVLPNGAIRRGLLGKIDLEAYDYRPGSQSPVRATEATVLERIPPRCKIRGEASVELPHILLLMNDKNGVFDSLASEKSASPLYDFELMQGGGRLSGWGVSGQALDRLMERIAEYEASSSGVVYAMGDGNHSLAAAKAHYENLRASLGEAAASRSPARYALCELTALNDDSLVFEPIYRILQNCDPEEVATALDALVEPGSGAQELTVVRGSRAETVHFTAPTHALTVGTLQNFLDDFTRAHPGVKCDYIHGENVLRELARKENAVGFLFAGMDKAELFPYVETYGALPRKTFSMGEAKSKRYYMEMREIR